MRCPTLVACVQVNMSYITGSVPAEVIPDLFARAYAALQPGGMLGALRLVVSVCDACVYGHLHTTHMLDSVHSEKHKQREAA